MFGLGNVLTACASAIRSLDETRAAKRKLVVEHVRYVKQPAVDPVAKAIAMAKAMGRNDLVERLEG